MKLTDKQKKQIEKDLNGPPENFLLFFFETFLKTFNYILT